MTERISDPDLAIYEGIKDPRLTPQECEDLIYRDGHGITAVPMRRYETLDDFMRGANNFHLMFTAKEGGIAWHLSRGKKVFQRFAILHSQLADSLTVRLQSKGQGGLDKSDWELLHDAYEKMSTLVDVDDPSVKRDGQIDDWFLCR